MTVRMTALTVQNPRYKCDWETRMTTDKKIIAEIIIIILIYICVCVTTYTPVLAKVHNS